MTKVKRPDIQGIRGLAIASVLGFHFNGEHVPAGFLGVDIFFVLSGYLMSFILAREVKITGKGQKSLLADFYIRRFKRIVPLYAILMLALCLFVPLMMLRSSVDKFIGEAIWAATFTTNMHDVVEQIDYFAALNDPSVLTHTWSLGVEIQYYVIVPLIISVHRLIGKRIGLLLLLLLVIGSFTFQCLTSLVVAFNALPSRVWQFLVGAIAHECITWPSTSDITTKHVDSEDRRLEQFSEESSLGSCQTPNSSLRVSLIWLWTSIATVTARVLPFILPLMLFLLTLSPYSILPDQALRAIVVVLTGVIIVIGAVAERQSVLLTNQCFVYLGDLSYIAYLVHWPVAVIWKSYRDIQVLPYNDILSCLVITFLISIIFHHTLEQYFIKSSTKIVSITVVGLYLLMICAAVFQLPQALNDLVWRTGEK